MTTDLIVGRDEHSNLTYSRELSDTSQAVTLAADTDTTLVVPADNNMALIGQSAGANIIVKRGGTAITQPGGSFESRPDEDINVAALNVTAGETLHLYSIGDAQVVYLHFYRRGGDVA